MRSDEAVKRARSQPMTPEKLPRAVPWSADETVPAASPPSCTERVPDAELIPAPWMMTWAR